MASKSAEYYRSHPEARRRKMLYDRKYHSTPARKAYRRKLARVRRAKGVMGKGGKDVSHKGNRLTLEIPKKNRARGGAKRR